MFFLTNLVQIITVWQISLTGERKTLPKWKIWKKPEAESDSVGPTIRCDQKDKRKKF